MLRRRLYYTLKPFLPWSLRAAVRRRLACRRREASHAIWPIHHAAGRAPLNWPGWPDGRQFAVVLTHDVEGPEGLAKCRRLAELERSLGFRSAFNFIPDGSYTVSAELREQLAQDGFEIGVHDLHHDGGLYRSPAAFRRNADRINRYLREWGARGFRSGFMFHRLDWLHDLAIDYDTSTFDTDPFEPQPDAAGTIFPFWVPPPDNHPTAKGFVEIPYTLPQDSTLFLIFQEESPAIWLEKLDWIAERGGMAMVNVHPDYLRFPGDPVAPRTYPVEHYIALLQRIREKYAGAYWPALPRQVADFAASHRVTHKPRRARRVCLITYSFYERDTRVLRYGEALAQRGDEVEVLSLRSSAAVPREEIVHGCRVVRLQERAINEKSPGAFLLRLGRFLWQSQRWVSRNHALRPFDLIHVHNVPDFLVFAGWRAKLSGAKILLDIHDIVPELFSSKFNAKPNSMTIRLLRQMEWLSAKFADHVILANHLWLETYTKRSAPPHKVTVLINYVDREVFYPRRRTRADDRKIVIFPGSLQWHQGLDVAVRAFPKVVSEIPGAELHIYGEGQAKPDLIRLAASLGLNGHVKFFGFVPASEIASVMAEADLGVVPKRADSFGNEAFSTKILEFMSLGIPVVASSTKIDRYYFNDSLLRFFPSGDSDGLAGEIVQLLRQPGLRRELAARAAEYAELNSWSRRRNDYYTLVDRLATDTVVSDGTMSSPSGFNDTDIEGSLLAVQAWVEARNYQGYDPGDGLTSFLRPLTFRNIFAERLLQQAIWKSPVNLRPLLGVRPLDSTKGRGFMAWGYALKYKAAGQMEDRLKAEQCLSWLDKNREPGHVGHCWGNHFDFTTRGGRMLAHTPTIVWSGLIGQAFLEAFEQWGEERWLDVAESICQWILELPREYTADGDCLSYFGTSVHSVHNSNLLGAGLLARTWKHRPRPEFIAAAQRAVMYSCRRQRPDGSWWYAEEPKYHWIDNFHTAYNLDSLKRYGEATGDTEFRANLESGYRYFKEVFFEPSGRPRYYHNKTYPIDIQCAAQAIDTFAFFADEDPEALALSGKVAHWTVQNMQDRTGYFHYRHYPVLHARTPYFHWGQATTFKGLAHLASQRRTAAATAKVA